MYWDKNVDPYNTRNVLRRPMYDDRRGFRAFHPFVVSRVMPDVFDRPRAFRPVSR